MSSHLSFPTTAIRLHIGVATRLLKEFRLRKLDATFIIFNSCGVSVQAHINRTDDPKVMWEFLARIFDTANHTIGRQALFRDFMAVRNEAR
jgi:hypothetical protein